MQKILCVRLFIVFMCRVAKLWKDPKCPKLEKWLNNLYPPIHSSIQWAGMHPFKMMLNCHGDIIIMVIMLIIGQALL